MCEGWVEFRLEKSKEEVQEVDAKRVADWQRRLACESKDRHVSMVQRRCTYVPALSHENTNEEETQESTSGGPSVSGVGRTFIEIGLVYLVERA